MIEIVVEADAPDISGGDVPDGHLTLAEKEMCANIADTLSVGTVVMGTAAGAIALAGPELWGPAAYALAVSFATGLGAVGFNRLARDPADPNFTDPVSVHLLHLQGTSEVFDDCDIGPVFEAVNTLIPVVAGALTAYERAQGASDANDYAWSSKQTRVASFLRGSAASGAIQLADCLKVLPGRDLGAQNINQSDYADLARRAAKHELLPDDVRNVFHKGGVQQSDLDLVENELAKGTGSSLPQGVVTDLMGEVSKRLRKTALAFL